MKEENLSFEAHQDYTDLHVMITGKEYIGVSNISVLEEFEKRLHDDYMGYQGLIENKCHITSRDFVIVLPEDAHTVKLCENYPSTVKKAVFKIRIEDTIQKY